MVSFQGTRRFFLPNEDCEVVRQALKLLEQIFYNPLLVTGSGILALDLLPLFPNKLTLIDIQETQTKYALKVISAIKNAKNTKELLKWLQSEILPQINAYYANRGEKYTFDGMVKALKEYFRINLFFVEEDLKAVQKRLDDVYLKTDDIISYLQANEHDFVHLSNIVDYLDQVQLKKLFQNLRKMQAKVFCIETTAMNDRDSFLKIVQNTGYVEHPKIAHLQANNQALGGNKSLKPWMRQGSVHLFL